MKTFIMYAVAIFEACILAAFVATVLIYVDIAQKEYYNRYGLYDSLKK